MVLSMSTTKLSPGAQAVLGLLSRRPTSGYELGSLAERTIAHFWPITRAHIYAELARLEAAGLVTATEVAQRGRPDKRVYAITEAGEAALDAWLAGPELGHERRRHPLLLKVFFGERIPPARLAGLLAEERARLEADRDHFLAVAARLEGDPRAVWRRATALYGVRCAEGGLAWLDEVEPLVAAADRSA
jgi:PadR family transcriptional regulator, regulatory protein AphA